MITILSKIAKQVISVLPAKWEREIYWQKRRKYRMKAIREWEMDGKPAPPPHQYKQLIIEDISRKHHLEYFVETGTFLGHMIESQRKNFKHLYSVELDKNLHTKAKEYFAPIKNIQLIYGDSARELSTVVKQIKEPILFWLDGHYCGEGTGLGDVECPVFAELETIFGHYIRGSYVLIDDARLFNGTNDYPTVQQITDLVKSKNQNQNVFVLNDIIHIH